MIFAMDVFVLVLIISGALLCLSSAVGVARFRDTVSRMHASSKPQTLGLILTLSGALIHLLVHAERTPQVLGDLGLLFLIICFAFGTAPIIANRVGHEAVKESLYDAASLTRNDIAKREDSTQLEKFD